MAEYICREAILDDLEKEIEAGNVALDEDVWINKGLRIAIRDIKAIKAADVQRIKHGYWEEVTDYGGWGDTHYRCSVCGEEWYLEDGKPKDNNMNFCPRCGAKMDAEPDEPWQSE